MNEELETNKESRVIIFLLERDHCKKLAQQINTKTKYKADILIGKTTKEDDKGLNAAMQKKKVVDFSKGLIQVLCVTTVAEEGLDISDCRLVIEYNNVGNEIGHLQRKGFKYLLLTCLGRGRAKNAKSVLLTSDENVKNKAEQNAIWERIMEESLLILDRKSLSWFNEQVLLKS